MIKANEIRVGNLFNVFKDTPYPVAMIGLFDVQLFTPSGDLVQDKISELQPIPLTEEILLKCGFVWLEDFEQEKALILSLNQRIKIGYYKGDVKCCSIYQDGRCVDFRSNSHPNLHQLQNLIFALTNEELKIEL